VIWTVHNDEDRKDDATMLALMEAAIMPLRKFHVQLKPNNFTGSRSISLCNGNHAGTRCFTPTRRRSVSNQPTRMIFWMELRDFAAAKCSLNDWPRHSSSCLCTNRATQRNHSPSYQCAQFLQSRSSQDSSGHTFRSLTSCRNSAGTIFRLAEFASTPNNNISRTSMPKEKI
jgi:hypothetical protein